MHHHILLHALFFFSLATEIKGTAPANDFHAFLDSDAVHVPTFTDTPQPTRIDIHVILEKANRKCFKLEQQDKRIFAFVVIRMTEIFLDLETGIFRKYTAQQVEERDHLQRDEQLWKTMWTYPLYQTEDEGSEQL